MEQNTKYFIMSISISFAFLTFIFFNFYLKNDFHTSILATMVLWAFYILCIPGSHGKLILGAPYKFITKKTLKYPELIVWPLAAFFTIYSVLFFKNIYFISAFTNLFYVTITNPWPHWLIFFVSGFGTFYRFIIGYDKFFANKYLHYTLRTIIIIFSCFILFQLSYKELIILLNILA
ncbi:hypothetical protein KJ644_03700 [Candidatus Dependentiae bacterium]|nr:hypothetical protein [Candidatus Dependentiae bacterium]MBU4387549.1 hypothetical protein [Candidatus Dependentiae bacterium]MCG2756624.1 hypothetical protein [Candidatus Dependentiae bacterium]